MGDLGLVQRVEGVRGGEGGERLVPHALDLFRFQRLDLDRVVRLIGCRHLFHASDCWRMVPVTDSTREGRVQDTKVPKAESNGVELSEEPVGR
ncbi:hypothetical protein GCM10009566_23260 [Streptomyces murinus]|uniref:Uncharacterized protein n=2 Tax=Actinomycetes TaxID=1760 RepID=A0ABN3M8G0_9ACTN|nr:hypothetical protein SRO_5870 [Streptomyces rochei]